MDNRLILVDSPKDPQFNKPENYDMGDVVNFYITTQDLDNITLVNIGNWMIVHEEERGAFENVTHTSGSASNILANTKKPVVIYMHGVACNRVKPTATYSVIRKHFVIIAPDHRGKTRISLDTRYTC